MTNVKTLPPPSDRPASKWPIRPAGGGSVCAGISAWLYPHDHQRPLTEMISNSRDAYRWVYAVSTWLLEDLRAEEKSQHLADERDRLNAIVEAAKTLLTKTAAYSADGGHLHKIAIACEFLEFNADQQGCSYARVKPTDILRRPLEELIKRAERAICELEAVGRSGRDKDSLFTKLYGSPQKTLAVRCAVLLIEARGDEKAAPITDNDTGPVAELISRIWTYATGEEADQQFGRLAKEAAKIARSKEGRPSLRRDNKQAEILSMLP